jgi:hypothetical protein
MGDPPWWFETDRPGHGSGHVLDSFIQQRAELVGWNGLPCGEAACICHPVWCGETLVAAEMMV